MGNNIHSTNEHNTNILFLSKKVFFFPSDVLKTSLKEKKNDCNKTKWQIKTISKMNLTFSLCSAKQF
jgi:hypothetical protein